LAIIVISPLRIWFYAAASMEIKNSDPLLASQTTFRHDRVYNMREIPFDEFAAWQCRRLLARIGSAGQLGIVPLIIS